MTRITLTLVILLLPVFALAQDEYGFPFGKATYADFEMKTYPGDTSAGAYMIKETGEAHVDYETNNKIIFTYHAKIRILKQSEVGRANISIRLRKSNNSSSKDELGRFQASAFNLVNNRIEETRMDLKAMFIERNGKRNYDEAKFAIPNVRAGTVIEYHYEVTSPVFRDFREWDFQSDIPKQYSEFWTVIPANYVFNITLRGYLQLTDRKDKIIDHCVVSGSGEAGCTSTRYIMTNIPAFKEEEYMKAKGNYISAINFELSEVRGWRGEVNRFTKEWKDADEELKLDDRFGLQLRKNRNLFEGRLDASTLSEPDPLKKAMRIYDVIKFGISWNEYYGAYTDVGIKKAVEDKKGNVADINLALVAALQEASLEAEPVMLATRQLEQPVEIHPVLDDFNYVIARLKVGDKYYLLDAVDDFLPFGLISENCYNGKGRVISDAGSYWIDLKPADRNRLVTQVNLKLSKEGTMTGTITQNYFGYASVDQRKKIVGFADEKSYLDDMRSRNHGMDITSYQRTAEDDLSKPFVETFAVEMAAFDTPQTTHFLFNPFFLGKMEKNPFKTETRTYPVDFGVPFERNLLVAIEYPDSFEVTSVPDKIGLALPSAGGRYIYAAISDGTKLNVNNLMTISKPVYAPEEYPFLRELYARKLQAENADIIFQRKK